MTDPYLTKHPTRGKFEEYTLEWVVKFYVTNSYDFIKLTNSCQTGSYRVEGFRNGKYQYLTFFRIKDMTKKRVFLHRYE